MTLFVHPSHRAEALAERLASVLAEPTDAVLTPDAVVVHSPGLERWLSMQLAERLGVCANVRFPFPGELVAEVLASALGPEADPSRFGGDRLVWGVRAALEQLRGDAALAPIDAYLSAGGPEEGQRRVQGLAARVAAVFERYAVYRPELVRGWRAGLGEGWEPPLFRAVAARLGADDAATLVERLEARLADGASDLRGLPARVAVFSVSTLPPLHLRVLAALARHRDVHLLVLHPSPAWWARGREGRHVGPRHPLLASMGRLTGELQRALLEVEHVATAADSTPGEASSTLAALQADVHADAVRERALDPDDRSLSVHVCHGPTRQVQVLRDVLLALFEELPELEPRDVVVMAPDIETYAPLVDAVFSDGETWERRAEHPGGLPRIRFRLADRGVRSENPVAEALLAILSLASTRLSASAVLDLLALDPVRQRFGIEVAELPEIRAWVAGCGARWGRDAAHRAEAGQPVTDEYTWRFGLRRLLLGQALLEDETTLGAAPWGDVEGRDARALLGRLVDFAEALFEAIDRLDGEASLEAWRGRLLDVLDRLIDTAPEERWQLQKVRAGLAQLAEDAADAGFDSQVDRAAILVALEGRFGAREPGAGYLSGAVTFCQLVPMRSIPFRVVCLLGMDDGEFPRIGARPGFDRMARERMVGDRSARDDDRALFLEALLSARDRLVILTSGRGVSDDRPRPPAVPVSELLDVVDATFGARDGRAASAHLTHHHPLSPFSPRVFDGRHGFDRRMLVAALAARAGEIDPVTPAPFLAERLPPAPAALELDLRKLGRFWQHPMRALCETRLGLYLREDEDPVEDREPLAVEGLEAWKVCDALLARALEGAPVGPGSAAHRDLRRSACLPLGTPGLVAYEKIARIAEDIAARARARRGARGAPGGPVEVSFEAAGVRLSGHVADRYGTDRVAVQAGSIRDKHEVAVWIEHLAMAASGAPGHTFLLGRGAELVFAPLDPARAREALARLLALYREGMEAPLPFFPSTSRAYLEGLRDGDAVEAARRARGAWRAAYDEPGEHGELVLGGAFPFHPSEGLPIPKTRSVEELARAVWELADAHRVAAPDGGTP